MDTGRTETADERLAWILLHRRYKDTSTTDERMTSPTYTADILETVETNKNATGEPDSTWSTQRQSVGMGEYPERLLVYSRKLDSHHNAQQ